MTLAEDPSGFNSTYLDLSIVFQTFFLEKNPGLTRKLFFEGEEATLALILQKGQGLDAIFVRFLFSQISHILISELNDYEIRSIMFDH